MGGLPAAQPRQDCRRGHARRIVMDQNSSVTDKIAAIVGDDQIVGRLKSNEPASNVAMLSTGTPPDSE